MSGKTEFGGLEYLEAGEPLSTDGYYFMLRNPQITAFLLQLGAVLHRHDEHVALADPTTDPTLSSGTTGGSIPSALTIYVTYTLIDGDGGETLPIDSSSVTTTDGYDNPDTAPTTVLSYSAGSLLVANYDYGVTVTDGAGGETLISPNASVTIPPGHANAEVTLSGFSTITSDASGSDAAAGWRLWRRVDGGVWYLIATGATGTDGFVDNGSVGGDCTVEPPLSSTTQGANTLSVTVPSSGQPAGAVSFSIYASLDGSFNNPALLGTYPVADYDAAKVYSDLSTEMLDGSPPAVSLSIPGASKIDPVSDIDWTGGSGAPWDDQVIYYHGGVGAIRPIGSGDVATLNTLDAGTVTDAALRAFGTTYAVATLTVKAGMSLNVETFAEVETDAGDNIYTAVWAAHDQADPANPSLAPEAVLSAAQNAPGGWTTTDDSVSWLASTDAVLYVFFLCGAYNSDGTPGTYWTGVPGVPASDNLQKAICRVH